MKSKAKLVIVLLALFAVIISSCNKEDELIPLDQFTVNVPTVELSVGEVQPIIASTTPENTTENLNWTSSDETIAVIQFSENGRVAGVKGMALGNTTLTATNPDGTISQTVTASVIIKVERIELEEVPLPSPSETMYQVVFHPADASIQTATWSSSDPSVASVVDGLITAVSPGVSVITATSDQGAKTASVEIAVSGDPPILGYQYCTVSGTGGYHADAVSTSGADTDINYSGVQDGNYELYEAEKIIVQPGGAFDLSLTQANNWSLSVVWIDWNGDKDFVDDGERVQIFGEREQLNDGPFSATINVPADATPGVVRMRILTGDSWTTDPDAVACGEVANSSTKDFLIGVGGAAYCSAFGTGSYNSDAVITTGGGTNIDYTGGQPSGNYEYFTSEKVSVLQGSSFDLAVTQSNNWSMTVVWIDWNANGDFTDEGEKVQIFGEREQINDGPFSATINVPADAVQGMTRMRILTGDSWTTDPDVPPCGEIANSTIKDFDVEITGVEYCSVSGTGDYNADAVSTTGGDTNLDYSGDQPSGNYEYYTDETLGVAQGGNFNLSVTQSNNWSMTVVWIDWNADGDFDDDGEKVQEFGVREQMNDGPFSAQIDVPADAAQGVTRMRVLTGDSWTTDPAIPPCGEVANSTSKDFNIKIQ